MKYPLKVVPVTGREWSVAISDSDGKIIANVIDQEWGLTFAVFVVKAANRWHKLRPWFRPYTREDWLAQRDPWKMIKADRDPDLSKVARGMLDTAEPWAS